MKHSKFKSMLSATAACTALTTFAHAEEAFQLRFAHTYPADHFLWKQAGEIFTQQVTERTNGRVTFEVYPSGQLGKESLAVMDAGLTDVAIIIPALAVEKLPLSEVTQLPHMYETTCEGAAMFRAAATGEGFLNKKEYEPNGFRYVYSFVNPPYSLMTRSKATPTLESLSGQKIRVVGGTMSMTMSELGAVPITIPSTEMYDSLTRGTIDGTIYARMALDSLGLEAALKYSIDGVRLGNATVVMAISQNAWDNLPADVQQVITEVGQEVEQHLCEWTDKREAEMSLELVEKNGWEIIELPEEEAARWRERIDRVTEVWAKGMDSASLNGTEAVEAFQSLRPTSVAHQ